MIYHDELAGLSGGLSKVFSSSARCWVLQHDSLKVNGTYKPAITVELRLGGSMRPIQMILLQDIISEIFTGHGVSEVEKREFGRYQDESGCGAVLNFAFDQKDAAIVTQTLDKIQNLFMPPKP